MQRSCLKVRARPRGAGPGVFKLAAARDLDLFPTIGPGVGGLMNDQVSGVDQRNSPASSKGSSVRGNMCHPHHPLTRFFFPGVVLGLPPSANGESPFWDSVVVGKSAVLSGFQGPFGSNQASGIRSIGQISMESLCDKLDSQNSREPGATPCSAGPLGLPSAFEENGAGIPIPFPGTYIDLDSRLPPSLPLGPANSALLADRNGKLLLRAQATGQSDRTRPR